MHSLKSTTLTRPGYLRLGVLLLALTLIALLAMPTPVRGQAAVQVSNLGQSDDNDEAVHSGNILAQEFTTGSNSSGYDLGYINLDVNDAPDAERNALVSVAIHTDSSGGLVPGATVLYELARPGHIGTGNQKFTAPTGATLAPGTDYWVVVKFNHTDTGDFKLDGTVSNSEDSGTTTGWSMGDAAVKSTDGGVGWSTFSQGTSTLALRMFLRSFARTSGSVNVVPIGTLVSNVGTSEDTNEAVYNARRLSQKFTTGSHTSGYRLSGVVLDVRRRPQFGPGQHCDRDHPGQHHNQ